MKGTVNATEHYNTDISSTEKNWLRLWRDDTVLAIDRISISLIEHDRCGTVTPGDYLRELLRSKTIAQDELEQALLAWLQGERKKDLHVSFYILDVIKKCNLLRTAQWMVNHFDEERQKYYEEYGGNHTCFEYAWVQKNFLEMVLIAPNIESIRAELKKLMSCDLSLANDSVFLFSKAYYDPVVKEWNADTSDYLHEQGREVKLLIRVAANTGSRDVSSERAKAIKYFIRLSYFLAVYFAIEQIDTTNPLRFADSRWLSMFKTGGIKEKIEQWQRDQLLPVFGDIPVRNAALEKVLFP